ncbi:MAG: hypothetical protein HYX68_06535 [Planctomycetes bacterium]|nr:hypothetical protein [Planctomycetota bacterium]
MTRWQVWSLFVVAWTLALEVPVPDPGHLPAGAILSTNKYLFAKTLHVAAYAGLTAFSGWVVVASRHRWLMMLFLMGHATASELLQAALEPYCHRGGSLTDVGFDQLGILLGTAVGWRWWIRE